MLGWRGSLAGELCGWSQFGGETAPNCYARNVCDDTRAGRAADNSGAARTNYPDIRIISQTPVRPPGRALTPRPGKAEPPCRSVATILFQPSPSQLAADLLQNHQIASSQPASPTAAAAPVPALAERRWGGNPRLVNVMQECVYCSDDTGLAAARPRRGSDGQPAASAQHVFAKHHRVKEATISPARLPSHTCSANITPSSTSVSQFCAWLPASAVRQCSIRSPS